MFAVGPAVRTTHGRTVTEMTYDFNEETTLRNERYTQLNADQNYCFDTIVARVRDYPRPAHFFVHGPAGTGKTFLYMSRFYTARPRHSAPPRAIVDGTRRRFRFRSRSC